MLTKQYLHYKKQFLKFNLCNLGDNIILNRHPIDNIYFATVQKSGSQWIRKLFKDKRIKKYTHLRLFPQHLYEYGDFYRKFPLYTYVPGLYISYQAYDLFIDKPQNYKTIYIYRDPRNIVVSWYYSMLKTHTPIKGVIDIRRKLKNLSKHDGLLYCISFLNEKFTYMRSWIELGKNDPNVLFIKFEELMNDNFTYVKKIFDFCKISISEEELKLILKDYTKIKLREADLLKQEDKTESHYRKHSSSHVDEFSEEHYKLFYETTGNLINVLGYEK